MPLYELTTEEPTYRSYHIEADNEEDARRRFEARYEDYTTKKTQRELWTPVNTWTVEDEDNETVEHVEPLPAPVVKADSPTSIFDRLFTSIPMKKGA